MLSTEIALFTNLKLDDLRMIGSTQLKGLGHLVGLYKPPVQTTEQELRELESYAADKMRLAEIGVSQGQTTKRLVQVMSPRGIYFAVDPYFRGRLGINVNLGIAKRESKGQAKGDLRWVRTTGQLAPEADAAISAGGFDFVFFDGDHSFQGLQGDWVAWRSLIQVDGIAAFHDTVGGRFGCEDFLREHILTDQDFQPVSVVDSLTVLRRIACTNPDQ